MSPARSQYLVSKIEIDQKKPLSCIGGSAQRNQVRALLEDPRIRNSKEGTSVIIQDSSAQEMTEQDIADEKVKWSILARIMLAQQKLY